MNGFFPEYFNFFFGGGLEGRGLKGGGHDRCCLAFLVAGSIPTALFMYMYHGCPYLCKRKNNGDTIDTLHYMNFIFVQSVYTCIWTSRYDKKYQVIEQKLRNGRMKTPGLFAEQRQTESNFVIIFAPSASAKCNKGLSKVCNYIGTDTWEWSVDILYMAKQINKTSFYFTLWYILVRNNKPIL